MGNCKSQNCFVLKFWIYTTLECWLFKWNRKLNVEKWDRTMHINAGFRLTCRLPHCRFDDDICSTAQAPLAAEGWPSGRQRQANRSITLPLCPPRQIVDGWILFNSGAMPLGDKAKAALPLRAATLKQEAMITRHSGKWQASLKPALILWKALTLCKC